MSGHDLSEHLDALSAKFEGWLAPKPSWSTGEMTAGRREAMMKAIVGLVMTVDDIEGSFKLNQHKSDVDHAAIAIELLGQAMPTRKRSENGWSRCGRVDYDSLVPAGAPADGRNAP